MPSRTSAGGGAEHRRAVGEAGDDLDPGLAADHAAHAEAHRRRRRRGLRGPAARTASPGRCAPPRAAARARCLRSSSIVPRANRPWRRRGLRLDREVGHDRAGAGLGARVDAGDAAPSPARDAVDLQAWRGGRSSSAADVLGRQRRLELELRQVDDLDQLRVDRDPFAGLHHALRHQAGDRRDQRRVVAASCAPARPRPGPRRSVARAPASFEIEVSRPVARDEALRDQRAVVLERAGARCRAATWSTTRSARPASASARARWCRAGRAPGRRGPGRLRAPSSDFTSAATAARTTALLTAFSPPETSRRARQIDVARRRRRRRRRGRVRRRRSRRGARPARPGGLARDQGAGDEAAEHGERDHAAAATSASASSRPPLLLPGASSSPAGSRWRRRAGVCRPCSTRSICAVDHRLRVELRAGDAGAERMLVHDQEEQRRDQRMDDVLDLDRPELAAVDAALDDLGDHRCEGAMTSST